MHAKRAASVLIAICLAAGQLCSAAPAAKAGAKGQFIFQYKSMPYVDVVRRFAQALKRPLIGDLNIEGTLTFFDAEPYTTDEALDTLNLLLSMRGYRLIERGRYLQLIPLSEVPGTTGELHAGVDAVKGKRPGKVVTVLLPVKHMVAKDAAKLVVRKVSPFGSISPMPRGKGIIITDTVANIQRIRNFLAVFDTEEHTGRQMKTITLEHAMATDVARTIDNIFGAKAAVIRKYGEYRSSRTRPPVDPMEVVNALADARTNMLFLTGAGEQLARAEKLIKSIDTEKESSDLRIFQLKKARAAKLAKTLNAVMPKRTITYGVGAHVRTKSVPIAQVVPDEGSNRLIVYAPPEQMPRIEKLIKEFDDVRGLGGASIFRLKFADARQLSRVISGATGRTDSRGRVRSRLSVGYDSRTNTLIISGPPEDLDIAAKVIGRSQRIAWRAKSTSCTSRPATPAVWQGRSCASSGRARAAGAATPARSASRPTARPTTSLSPPPSVTGPPSRRYWKTCGPPPCRWAHRSQDASPSSSPRRTNSTGRCVRYTAREAGPAVAAPPACPWSSRPRRGTTRC